MPECLSGLRHRADHPHSPKAPTRRSLSTAQGQTTQVRRPALSLAGTALGQARQLVMITASYTRYCRKYVRLFIMPARRMNAPSCVPFLSLANKYDYWPLWPCQAPLWRNLVGRFGSSEPTKARPRPRGHHRGSQAAKSGSEEAGASRNLAAEITRWLAHPSVCSVIRSISTGRQRPIPIPAAEAR